MCLDPWLKTLAPAGNPHYLVRSNENLQGLQFFLVGSSSRSGFQLVFVHFTPIFPFPWPGPASSMIQHEIWGPQPYRICLISYCNCVKLNSCNTSYNMYVYIYTHVHIPSPGSGSPIESWLIRVDCPHSHLADSDSFWLSATIFLLVSRSSLHTVFLGDISCTFCHLCTILYILM